MSVKRITYALVGLVMTGLVASAAVVQTNIAPFTGPQDPSQIFFYLNTLIAQLNNVLLANFAADFNNPRNLVDNGQMQVQQRGTGTRTCGTTTVPSTAYAADRFGCNVNVTSGAGVLQVITTGLPASPVFNAGLLFYRNSGSLAQPQCVMQEIVSSKIVPLQGQTVALSFYAQGLAAMLAEQTTLNAYLFTGTGTDQGLGSFTATPAITPAWTNIASTQTTAFTLTSAWQRFTTTFNIGSTVTEAAVALCWTPTVGGTAGVTDGFQFTGVQLEEGSASSAFEYRPFVDELRTAQNYYYRFAEKAATYPVNGFCQATTANTNSCTLALPQPMVKIPTIAITTAGTFKVNIANTLTTIATPTAGNCDLTACIVTAANTNTAGQVEQLTGAAGGTGVWEVSADF